MSKKENVIRINSVMVHHRMVDGNLGLFLYLNNEDYVVPENWHTSNDFMEIEHHFSITNIFESMYAGYCSSMPSKGSVIIDKYKNRFDALKTQLEVVLANINAIEYVTQDDYKEEHSSFKKLSNEEINEVIAKSEITLKNYCSEDKQIEFARQIEARLREKNL